MKKHRSIQGTVKPRGYTGNMDHFNRWQLYIHKQLDKIKGTTLFKKVT